MTSSWLLKTPVSRPNSIKAKLAALSWERGISPFFTDGVPFSWSTSTTFAKIVTDYLLLVKSHQKETVHCYEIGSGLGQLSQKILRTITKKKEMHHIQFHISDYKDSIVNTLKKNTGFAPFENIIQFDKLSFDNLKFSRKMPPHFVILSYILDALPHYHLRWENNILQEEKVISYLTKKPLLATNNRPFTAIEPENIVPWLDQQSNQTLLNHLHRIGPCFKERHKLDLTLPITKMEHDYLKAYFKYYKIKNCRFNYSPGVITGFKKLCEAAPDTFLWLIQDFGNFRPDGIGLKTKMILSCDVSQFYTQHLHLLCYIAKTYKFNIKHTIFPNNDTQHLIIYRGIPNQKVNKLFRKATKEPFAKTQIKLAQSVNRISAKTTAIKFKEKISQLTEKNDLSYHTMLVIAKQFFLKNMFLESQKYTQKIINEYHEFAISAQLLHAQCYGELNQLTNGLEVLEKAITIAPYVQDLYLHQSIIALKKQDYDTFIKTVQHYIVLLPNFPIWSHIMTFYTVLKYHYKKKSLADHYLAQLKLFNQKGYFRIPDKVLDLAN